ncbi:MAG: ABC transporter substrate-binding protein, partial [Chloroflexota bacterium]
LIVLALLVAALGACGPSATSAPTTAAPTTAAAAPTAAPTATTAPKPTDVPKPTTPPVAAFQGDKIAAPDCNYGTTDAPAGIKSIVAVDQYTVVFTLCHQNPTFTQALAFLTNAIQEKSVLNATKGDTTELTKKPNGTGPYTLKEWVHGDHITFEANPNYWGDKPKAKTVILRWSKEAAQRLLELQSGTVDGITNVAVDDIANVQKDAKLKLYSRDPLTIVYLAMNNTKKPFDNEKVRQAVAMGIDRKRIVDNFYSAGSVVAEQFAPPALKPGHNDAQTWYKYDPAAAKKILADAGFPNGFSIDLSYREVTRVYLPSPGKVAQDIQAQLKDIGVTVKLTPIESSAFIKSARAGDQAFYILGWGADYPDATNFYDTHFSAAVKQFGTVYSDIAAEINAGGSIFDPAERQKHYDKVNDLLKQHVPMIPLAHGTSSDVFKASVKGAFASPIENEKFYVMDAGSDKLVYMQNAEPGVLWCADEEDGETFRACLQIYESLLTFKTGGVDVVPSLAEKWTSSADGLVWTFNLRKGVKFFSGHELDANDVVASFESQWNEASPNHTGEKLGYTYFGSFFGAFLNHKK